jgi:hypothetical protein
MIVYNKKRGNFFPLSFLPIENYGVFSDFKGELIFFTIAKGLHLVYIDSLGNGIGLGGLEVLSRFDKVRLNNHFEPSGSRFNFFFVYSLAFVYIGFVEKVCKGFVVVVGVLVHHSFFLSFWFVWVVLPFTVSLLYHTLLSLSRGFSKLF